MVPKDLRTGRFAVGSGAGRVYIPPVLPFVWVISSSPPACRSILQKVQPAAIRSFKCWPIVSPVGRLVVSQYKRTRSRILPPSICQTGTPQALPARSQQATSIAETPPPSQPNPPCFLILRKISATLHGFIPMMRLFNIRPRVLLASYRISPYPEIPWLVSRRISIDRSECAIRMSVILSWLGPEFVFTCALTCSRSALVTKLPAATAAVADVELVMNFRRDTFGSCSSTTILLPDCRW